MMFDNLIRREEQAMEKVALTLRMVDEIGRILDGYRTVGFSVKDRKKTQHGPKSLRHGSSTRFIASKDTPT